MVKIVRVLYSKLRTQKEGEGSENKTSARHVGIWDILRRGGIVQAEQSLMAPFAAATFLPEAPFLLRYPLFRVAHINLKEMVTWTLGLWIYPRSLVCQGPHIIFLFVAELDGSEENFYQMF